MGGTLAQTRGALAFFSSVGHASKIICEDRLQLHLYWLVEGAFAGENCPISKTRPRIVTKLLWVAAFPAPHRLPESMLTEALTTTLRTLTPNPVVLAYGAAATVATCRSNPVMLAYGATTTFATLRLIHTPVWASRLRHWRLHGTHATITRGKRTSGRHHRGCAQRNQA